MKTERQDVYTQVTNTIITAIEAGAGDWQMPWHRFNGVRNLQMQIFLLPVPNRALLP